MTKKKEDNIRDWNWKYIGIGAGIFALAMAHPFTRAIILFLLPLGSGFDDFVEIAAIVIAVICAIAFGWIRWEKRKDFQAVDRASNKKVKQIVLVILGVMTFWLYPATGQSFSSAIFFGQYWRLQSLDFIVPAGIILAVMVIVWNVISFFDRRIK